jgi:hypothetical protein
LSIVEGPFSVAPRLTLALRFATFASLYSQVAYEHNHDRVLGGSEAESHIRDIARKKAMEQERHKTAERGHGPVGPPPDPKWTPPKPPKPHTVSRFA